MQQLFLDSNETFELYVLALRMVENCKKEVKTNYKFDLDEKICEKDEFRLKIATKLLDFLRITNKCCLISEIENPF